MEGGVHKAELMMTKSPQFSHVMWLTVSTVEANIYWDFVTDLMFLGLGVDTWLSLALSVDKFYVHILMTHCFDPKWPQFCVKIV